MSGHADRIGPLEQSHFWFVGRQELLLQLLKRHTRHGSHPVIADIGCGTGHFAGHLADAGHDVVAGDLDLPGRLPSGPAFFRCDLTRLPFPDQSIDVLFVRDVFEHVADDREAFLECRRVLSPGGILLATVPAWPSLWSQRDVLAGHKRRYTRSALKASCGSAGFDVIEMRGYQMWALPMFVVSRMMARDSDAQLRREEKVGLVNSALTIVTRLELLLGRVRFLRPRTGSSLVLVAGPHA